MTYSHLFRALYRVRRTAQAEERAALDALARLLWALRGRQEGRAQ